MRIASAGVCAATMAPEPSRERGRHMCSRVWHRACRWSAVGGPQRRAEPPTGATSGTDVQSVVGACAVMRPRVPRGLWVGVRGCVPTPAVYTRIGVWGSEKIPVFRGMEHIVVGHLQSVLGGSVTLYNSIEEIWRLKYIGYKVK